MRKIITIFSTLALVHCSGTEPTERTVREKSSIPSIAAVSLGDGPFYRSSLLVAEPVGWSIPDETPQYTYKWFANGQTIETAKDGQLNALLLKKSDTVQVEVTPVGKKGSGSPVLSNPVEIQDSLPMVLSVSIGSGPYYKSSTIRVNAWANDADEDPFENRYQWFVNDTAVPGQFSESLSGDHFTRGDVVYVEVTPVATVSVAQGPMRVATEAQVPGVPGRSNSITIENTAPTTVAANVNPPLATTGTNLIATHTNDSTDIDGDYVGYYYTWYKNGEPQNFPASVSEVPGEYVTGGDTWSVAVSPTDGYSSGYAGFSAGPVVQFGTGEQVGGAYHTCVRTSRQWVIRCWGRNDYGQLGDGSTVSTPIPVSIRLANNVVKLSFGYFHTCALLTDGRVQCWGDNTKGQLGQNNTTTYTALRFVTTNGTTQLGGVTDIASGSFHTCVIIAGAVQCWGSNAYGQIGNNTSGNQLLVPTVATGVTGAKFIAAGDQNTCANLAAAGVKCWGSNFNGQIGDGTTTARLTGVAVKLASATTLTNVADRSGALSVGKGVACAIVAPPLSTSNNMYCWGYGYTGGYAKYLSPNVAQVTSGAYHQCLLSTTNAVWCWGYNDVGQTGAVKALASQSVTTAVPGYVSGVSAVGAGLYHTCIQKKTGVLGGDVYCWGDNTYGQLGNGSVGHLEDVPVAKGGWAKIVSGGNDFTCAADFKGVVRCWGRNDVSQTGTAASIKVLQPTVVAGLPAKGVADIVVGSYHACVLNYEGEVWCWGYNSQGQLGVASVAVGGSSAAPVRAIASGAVSIGAGDQHTCALLGSGAVQCWGLNNYGQVGVGTVTAYYNVPTGVINLGTYTVLGLGVGTHHNCVLAVDGAGAQSVHCWGYNGYGQLGASGANRTAVNTGLPVAVGANQVTQFSLGLNHSCGRTLAGTAICWGGAYYGQLGNNTTNWAVNGVTNVQASSGANLTGVLALSSGFEHICAVLNNLQLVCWGANAELQIGNGSSANALRATTVLLMPGGATAIGNGRAHSCAVTNGGDLKCWGANNLGQLGDNKYTVYTNPQNTSEVNGAVGPLTPTISLGAGQYTTCAVKSAGTNGRVQCWGYNDNGQIGDGTYANRDFPVNSGNGDGILVASGYKHSCATVNNANNPVWCWGGNWVGQTGNGNNANPQPGIQAVSNVGASSTLGIYVVRDLAVGGYHACVADDIGAVVCWGWGAYGQLGNGGTAESWVPARVTNLDGTVTAVAMAGGQNFSCMQDSNKSIWCRGWRGYGEMGDGGGTAGNVPRKTLVSGVGRNAKVPVMPAASGAAPVVWTQTIEGGDFHGCYIDGSNNVRCWGLDDSGQIGDGAAGGEYWSPSGVIIGNAKSLGLGYKHSCVVLLDGTVRCWGANWEGQIGDNTLNQANSPVSPGLTGQTWVSAEDAHSCSGNGVDAWCWGRNRHGQLGDNDTSRVQSGAWPPTSVGTPEHVRAAPRLVSKVNTAGVNYMDAAVGGVHTCFLTTAGTVACSGQAAEGTIGNGLTAGMDSCNASGTTCNPYNCNPYNCNSYRCNCGWCGCWACSYQTCWNTCYNTCYSTCWTYDACSRAPRYVLAVSPDAGNLVNVKQVTAGDKHTCALVKSATYVGQVACWGRGAEGQMGNNSTAQQSRPVWVVKNTGGNLTNITWIGAGRNHTCAADTSGDQWCWGYNANNQVSETAGNFVTAVKMQQFFAKYLSAGASGFTCASMSTGGVKCWGRNDYGQLGTGNNTQYTTPVDVAGLTAVDVNGASKPIASGEWHTCVRQTDGTASCWGHGGNGQIGNNAWPGNQWSPVKVLTSGGVNVTGISVIGAGYRHTCASVSGSLKCWGKNDTGQLGTGNMTTVPYPVSVVGPVSNVAEMSGGETHSCVRLSSGAIQCWGSAIYGQLGNSVSSPGTPVQVKLGDTGAGGLVKVALGATSSCGIDQDDKVYCWGMNDYGQLGDILGGAYMSTVSTPVSGLPVGATAIGVGFRHACSLIGTEVWCWGDNSSGQSGGSSTSEARALAGLPSNPVDLAVGRFHNCVAMQNGTAACWGSNVVGQLGSGALSGPSSEPLMVKINSTTNLTGVAKVRAGGGHSCAITTAKRLYCWGSNSSGQLGTAAAGCPDPLSNNPPCYDYPIAKLTSLLNVDDVQLGDNHTCALQAGVVKCWGDDAFGQIGDNQHASGATPAPKVTVPYTVSLFSPATAISVAGNHSCAIVGGGMLCWGSNASGELGTGDKVDVGTPTKVAGLSTTNIISAFAGYSGTCARDSSAMLTCWGDDQSNQLGFWVPRTVMGF